MEHQLPHQAPPGLPRRHVGSLGGDLARVLVYGGGGGGGVPGTRLNSRLLSVNSASSHMAKIPHVVARSKHQSPIYWSVFLFLTSLPPGRLVVGAP